MKLKTAKNEEPLTSTLQWKLLPTAEQKELIFTTMNTYIATVNTLVSEFCVLDQVDRRTTADVIAELPACLKNQTLRDAKSVFRKYRSACRKADAWNRKHPQEPKTATCAVLKKPAAIWNNQNYSIKQGKLGFPVFKDGKSTKIYVNVLIPAEQLNLWNHTKHGTLRITPKGDKLIAQVAVIHEEPVPFGAGIMGVDLGLKIPAVCSTDTNKIRFVGNGRKNKYLKRKFRSDRKRLGKAKKLNAIRKSRNKEQRIMRDIDHKISREIVNFAIDQQIAVIRMEQLTGIRATARTSRKNEKNLHTWSFYRLSHYIEYKARFAGIRVEYVDPAYTSQTCPVCGKRNHAKDRTYLCSCGFHGHRDIVGAVNIRNAVPMANGNS
ncbi:MAG: transposase [Firmicutes bacterium]|nr:transposase [Bacillota bacterium]MBQ2271618.1 transposase [Bacillota bacterium]